ncbi:hypothetical protein PSACC_02580 [Paramicrosporidium saccamoebae]|uniref:Uncharacterized protein n=1 Tax=Paramicrosporidium saccamoebae TaxID=1246581 RepID=A0A2H9TIU7_9FUNG|nr:hypothetical protein PSACC_02580 [Paramicrosporidium saccamoebae]
MLLIALCALANLSVALVLRFTLDKTIWEMPRSAVQTAIESIDPRDSCSLSWLAHFYSNQLARTFPIHLCSSRWLQLLEEVVISCRELHSIFLNAEYLCTRPFIIPKVQDNYGGIIWREYAAKVSSTFGMMRILDNMERHQHDDLLTPQEWLRDASLFSTSAWKLIPSGLASPRINVVLETLATFSSDRFLVTIKIWQRIKHGTFPSVAGSQFLGLVTGPLASALINNDTQLIFSLLLKHVLKNCNVREASSWMLSTMRILFGTMSTEARCSMLSTFMARFPPEAISAYHLRMFGNVQFDPINNCPEFNHRRWRAYFEGALFYGLVEPVWGEPKDVRLKKWQILAAQLVETESFVWVKHVYDLLESFNPISPPISIDPIPFLAHMGCSSLLEVLNLHFARLKYNFIVSVDGSFLIDDPHFMNTTHILCIGLYKFTRTGVWDLVLDPATLRLTPELQEKYKAAFPDTSQQWNYLY